MVPPPQIAEGMAFLCDSERGIFHGDLATRNVLLTEKRVAKVSDFGLAKHLVNQEPQSFDPNAKVPVRWQAPELQISLEGDVFTYGVVLWEIFTLGETPYEGKVYTTLNQ